MMHYVPPSGPVPVLYGDSQILVVDKPSGLLSVPGKPAELADCVESRLRDADAAIRLVHRLDLDTSGVMVFARTSMAQRHLNWQFERREVRKTYVARVAGEVAGESGTIDLALACDWENRPRQKVDAELGRPAVTEWEVISREPGGTRLRLRPLTGRSHQIRVHLLALGHPILGDAFYAPPDVLAAAERLQLHAESLSFRHPKGGAWVTFRSPVPF